MALESTYTVDFDDDQIDHIDADNFLRVAGFHKVRIVDVEDKDGKTIITSAIIAGPSPLHGIRVLFFLPDPSESDDRQKATQRVFACATRVGLISKEQLKAAKAAGNQIRFRWIDAIGREVFLETESRVQKGGKYDGKVMVNPTYIPFYPLDDARVPEDARKEAWKTLIADKAADADKAAAAVAAAGKNGHTVTADPTPTPAASQGQPQVAKPANRWDNL